MNKHFVFVYGTLRRNEPNDFLLKDATLIAEQAWTYGEMYETNDYYPVLFSSEEERVYGELYAVTDEQLRKLDVLEGYKDEGENNLYDRHLQQVYTDTAVYEANVYVLHSNYETMKTNKIKYGDWKVHQLLKKEQPLSYFAFGSCMDQERFELAKVDHYFQRVKGRGVLEGYSLQFTYHVQDGGRADLVEDGGTAEGIVYELPYAAIDYLFTREGVHTQSYRPAVVQLTCSEGVLIDVLTFLVIPKQPELAPPFHYAREILRGGTGVLSEGYIQQVQKRFIEEFQVTGIAEYIETVAGKEVKK
ncbi:gamma-glutamylcyclotransferase [Bacillus tianshenii]|nr:gamma-glutamylcyclotransferase [Bacillus tianshenii]